MYSRQKERASLTPGVAIAAGLLVVTGQGYIFISQGAMFEQSAIALFYHSSYPHPELYGIPSWHIGHVSVSIPFHTVPLT